MTHKGFLKSNFQPSVSTVLTLFTFFYTQPLFAAGNFTDLFHPGLGTRVSIHRYGTPRIELDLSVVGVNRNWVDLEIQMKERSIGIPVTVWRQYRVERNQKGEFEVSRGFIFSSTMSAPQILPASHLQKLQRVKKATHLLFDLKAKIKKYFVKKETLSVPAGKRASHHYRSIQKDKKTGKVSQKIDFWLSDDVQPFQLVQLIAQGKENARVVLLRELTQQKPTIDPTQAVALGFQGKLLLKAAPFPR